MSEEKKTCRHKRAWPTIIAQTAGFLWCSDCGAFRLIEIVEGNQYRHSTKRWIYPRGHKDVLRQLEREGAV